MFEVGTRAPVKETLCTATPDEVEEKCRYTIEPGKIYEIRYIVDPPIKREDIGKIYSLFRDIETEYREVGVNYIMVSDSGKEIVFQIFDPPGWPAVAAAVIKLIIVLIAIYFAYLAVKYVYLGVTKVTEVVPKPPEWPWLSAAVWIGVSATLIGAGIYLVSRAVR